MNYKNFWIWDKDFKRCLNSRTIEEFEIQPCGIEKTKYKVYASLISKDHVIISEHEDEGEAKQKINNILTHATI